MTNEKDPSTDKWHTCPNNNENSIDPKILEEIEQMINEVLFIEKLNSKWGKKVD